MPVFVGMALLAGALAGTTLVAGTLVLGFSWAAFTAAVVMGGVSYLTAKKANAPQSSIATGRLVSIRSPLAAWQWGYGEARAGGVLTYVHEHSQKEYLDTVVTFAGCEVTEFNQVYFDDQQVPMIAGDTQVTGTYAGEAAIGVSLGDEGTAQPFPILESVSEGTWGPQHRQRGRSKLWVRLRDNPSLFSTGIPNITAVIRWRKIYDPRNGSTQWSSNPALALSDYLCHSVVGLGASYTNEIDQTALIAAANICDERVSLRNSAADPFTSAQDTNICTLGDADAQLATGTPILFNTTGTLPGGLESGKVFYAINVGDQRFKVAASRADALAGTAIDITSNGSGTHTVTRVAVFTADAATDQLTLAEGSVAPAIGMGVRIRTAGTRPGGLAAHTTYYAFRGLNGTLKLATTFANALAGTAIDITSAGTGTQALAQWDEARYSVNGAFRTDQDPRDIIEHLLAAMAGTLVYSGGKWHIYAGAYEAPTVTLDEGDLAGPIKVQTLVSRRENANAVKGVFTDPANRWTPTDFPALASETYRIQDGGGAANYRDIDLSGFVTSVTQAQRLAKIELLRLRQGLTVSAPFKLTAYRAMAGGTVALTNEKFGWTAKAFDVVGSRLIIAQDGTLGVHLELRETAAAVYDWATSEERPRDLAPNTNLPDPFTVAAPAGLTLDSGTAQLYIAGDGTIHSRIKMTWTLAAKPIVASGRAEVQFRKIAGSPEQDWTPSLYFDGALTQSFLEPVDDGDTYRVRMRFVNNIGVRSEWISADHTVVGKTALPEDVTGFFAAQNGNVVLFRWNQVGDIDLAGYEIRYGVAAIAWADATPVTRVTRGTQVTTSAVPPGVWDTVIKSRDTSGNYSLNAARKALTVTSQFDVIQASAQAPAWLGDKVNFVKHWTGVLIPDSTKLASDHTKAELFEQFVPYPYATCTYDAPEVGLAFDADVRVWADIDSVLGPGVSSGIADPQHQLDYRANAASYDGFEDWTIGTVNGRYFRNRMTLTTSIGKAVIRGFTPTIDTEERTETATGIAVSSSGSAVSFSTPFHGTPTVEVINEGSAPLIPTRTGVSANGFTAHLYNTSGVQVGGTAGYRATGV